MNGGAIWPELSSIAGRCCKYALQESNPPSHRFMRHRAFRGNYIKAVYCAGDVIEFHFDTNFLQCFCVVNALIV